MELQFSYVSAEDAHVCRFIAAAEQETDDDILYHSFLLKYDRRYRQWGKFQLPWEAGSLTMRPAPAREVLVLNPEGVIGRGYGNFRQELLAPSGAAGPAELGPMREVRTVGDGVVCVGMGRQTYAWNDGHPWTPIHTPQMVERQSLLEISGFNSVHGLSLSDFYAVGMNGEIWRCHAGVWQREDSPTNLALHRVRAMPDGRLVAVGQMGLILLRENGLWRETLRLDVDDVWDVCPHGNGLYVATTDALYRLDSHLGQADPVPVADVETFGHLDSAEGVLWSAGAEDIAYTVDGQRWEIVTP